MFIVHEWNWGWYETRFERRRDAEHYLCGVKEIARINLRPDPYLTDENGKRLYCDFEIKDKLQEAIDYFDYHNKNLTKKQGDFIDQLKEMLN